MSLTIRSWHLANGLTILVDDDTVNYYADYYNVHLSIRCQVAVKPKYLKAFKDNPHYDRAVSSLGLLTEYRREIVKAGVPGPDVAAVKEYLLQKFEETAVPYFEKEVFPERFVQKRFVEITEELSKRNRSDGRNGD